LKLVLKKSYSRNILGIILEVDEEKDLYEIDTKEGHLAQTYSRNQFNIYEEKFISKILKMFPI